MSGTQIPIDELSIVTQASGTVGLGDASQGTVTIPGLGAQSLSNLLSGVSPIVLSPSSTGTTASTGDSSTKIATTKFVANALTNVVEQAKTPNIVAANITTQTSYSIPTGTDILIISSASTIPSLTINFPSLSQNSVVTIIFTVAVTALAFTAASGQSVSGSPPTSASAGPFLTAVFTNNQWYLG